MVIRRTVGMCGDRAGGSGGGSTGTGGTYFTHEELAREFVRRMQTDVGANVTLMKANTEQYDYIVVYDYDTGTYDAYNLRDYNVGENMFNYLNQYSYTFYYDLYSIGGNRYRDPVTNITFEVATSVSSTDLLKMSVLKRTLEDDGMTSNLVGLGMEEGRARTLTQAMRRFQKAPAGTVLASDVEMFTKKFTGSGTAAYQAAIKAKRSGDNGPMNKLIGQIVQVNGVSQSGAQRINEIFAEI